jgi:GH15 family glucan-1,4-alpha-glucosidase
MLSDGRSTALVRPDGEIDWWCWPRMHSDPLCWSLLDPRGSGLRFPGAVHATGDDAPAGPVLSTGLRVDGRLIEVHDALLPCTGGTELVRLVRGVEQDLDVVHEAQLGGFGSRPATGPLRLRAAGTVTEVGTDPVRCRLTASRGEWVALLLAVAGHEHDVASLRSRLERAREDHDRMLAKGRYPVANSGRGRDALAMLHACTDAETGAVIASPTTSLPEVVGGNRNFDYRYSWLRDACTAIAIASMLGQRELADRYTKCLCGLGPEGILRAPVSLASGGDVPDEREVGGVAGWGGSQPVRIGNAARDQLQYDAIGLVLDALRVHTRARDRLSPSQWTIVTELADRVAGADPDEPSNGIWELRDTGPLVSGDVGRWLALDRALRLVRLRRPWTIKRSWIRAHDAARSRVLGAFLPGGALPIVYGGDAVDASALLLVVHELLRPRDPRAARLVDATIGALGCGPLLYRYEPDGRDGFDPGEAPFVPASWWAVTALAVLGRPEAVTRARALCAILPRLQPEEFDPTRGEALGNTPLLWSHAEAARALFEVDRSQSRWRRLARRLTGG